MINADQLVDGVKSLARHYANDDPMRWPFLLGAMEGKVRELVHLVNSTQEELESLKNLMKDN